jgi:hypothetical protein
MNSISNHHGLKDGCEGIVAAVPRLGPPIGAPAILGLGYP